MTPAIARQRCWTHPQREAVSRCPSCRRFYCRECVTEHDGRLLCVPCLAARAVPLPEAHGTRWVLWTSLCLLGLFLLYLQFFAVGRVLREMPPAWSQGVDSE